jgi:hypothetical protein
MSIWITKESMIDMLAIGNITDTDIYNSIMSNTNFIGREELVTILVRELFGYMPIMKTSDDFYEVVGFFL